MRSKLRLKEFIAAVPQGYARDRDSDPKEMKARLNEDLCEWELENDAEKKTGCHRSRRVLPIVHAYYCIFSKES